MLSSATGAWSAVKLAAVVMGGTTRAQGPGSGGKADLSELQGVGGGLGCSVAVGACEMVWVSESATRLSCIEKESIYAIKPKAELCEVEGRELKLRTDRTLCLGEPQARLRQLAVEGRR